MKVGDRLLYYSSGHDKRSQDGVFTNVTAITKMGRFRITADDEKNLYYPDTLAQITKAQRWSIRPYCRLINVDNKASEDRAMRRLWIDRINKVDLEHAPTELLISMVSTLNQHRA